MADKVEGMQEVTPVVKEEAAKPAVEAGEAKFTQADVDRIVGERVSKMKTETIEAAAEAKASEKAAEALAEVAAIKATLAATQKEAQIANLVAKGADKDLLTSSGLSGEALDTFGAKLIEVTGGAKKTVPGSASAEAAIASIVNAGARSAASGSDKGAEYDSWMSDQLDKLSKAAGK